MASVSKVLDSCVPRFVTVTLTPGMAAPEESVTDPNIVPKFSCALTSAATVASRHANIPTKNIRRVPMEFLPVLFVRLTKPDSYSLPEPWRNYGTRQTSIQLNCFHLSLTFG